MLDCGDTSASHSVLRIQRGNGIIIHQISQRRLVTVIHGDAASPTKDFIKTKQHHVFLGSAVGHLSFTNQLRDFCILLCCMLWGE